MIVDYPETGFSKPLADDEDARQRQQSADFAFFRVREHQWLQYQDGLLDAETWKSYLDLLVANLRAFPRQRERWARASELGLAPGFVADVNDQLLNDR